MAYRVLVLSPLHNMGSTVVSTLMSQGITFAGKTSTLMFTDQNSPVPKYLNLGDVTDPSRSVSQVYKLVASEAISDTDILNYSYSYSKNAYVMNVADATLTPKEVVQTVKLIYSKIRSDVVICDCTDDLDSDLTQELLTATDAVFIVCTMSPKTVAYMKEWMGSKVLENVNKYVIVNQYSDETFALRDFAKGIGVPANRVCKIHYNPWLVKTTFTGTLHTVLPLTMQGDYRVCNLRNDITEINGAISSDILLKQKKGF